MLDISAPNSLSADSLKRNYPARTPDARLQLPIMSSATTLLPAGGCQFILLHPSIQDQRCACQAYRRNRNIPGSLCECGHQACYHSPDAPHDPAGNGTLPTAYDRALMERINHLEAQLLCHQRYWQEQLDKERQLRREETRVLREAMSSLFKLMEDDVPGRLAELEDKIEGVMDGNERLERRFGDIDDMNMTLEDRVIKLEAKADMHPSQTRTISPEEDDEALDSNDDDEEDSYEDNFSTQPGSLVHTPRMTADGGGGHLPFHRIRKASTTDTDGLPDGTLFLLSQVFSLPSPPGQVHDLESPNITAMDRKPPSSSSSSASSSTPSSSSSSSSSSINGTETEHVLFPSPCSVSSKESNSETLSASQQQLLFPAKQSSSPSDQDSPQKRKRLASIGDLSAQTKKSLTDRRALKLPIPPPLSLSD